MRPDHPNFPLPTSLPPTPSRTSAAATEDLLKRGLAEALEAAIANDEKLGLDFIAFVDMILLLLFEGRGALAKVRGGLTRRVAPRLPVSSFPFPPPSSAPSASWPSPPGATARTAPSLMPSRTRLVGQANTLSTLSPPPLTNNPPRPGH